jgi:hypothetical protein
MLALLLLAGPSGADQTVSAPGGVAVGRDVIGPVNITTTINNENPETLKLLRETIADKNASEDKRREAEVKVAELAAKLGFTSQAVTRFFEILG